jgi:hypothetical protein
VGVVTATGTCATVPFNCFDCVRDGDEDGIDCGGSCSIEQFLECSGEPTTSAL